MLLAVDVFAPEWLDLQNDAFILKMFVKSELFVTFIEYKVYIILLLFLVWNIRVVYSSSVLYTEKLLNAINRMRRCVLSATNYEGLADRGRSLLVTVDRSYS